MVLPISDATWARLIKVNQTAVAAGWAEPGVFGTGVGPDYRPGANNAILYVGKSAGPLGARVGSAYDQAASVRASTDWMTGRINKSAFWQMIDKFDRSRRSLAWSNLVKMDRVGGRIPPKSNEWASIREACIAALAEEIENLGPRVALFATSDYLRHEIGLLASSLGYASYPLPFEDGLTAAWKRPNGQYLVATRHPQGWPNDSRGRVVSYVATLR